LNLIVSYPKQTKILILALVLFFPYSFSPKLLASDLFPKEIEQAIFVIPTPVPHRAVLKTFEIIEGEWQQVGQNLNVAVGNSGIIPKELKEEGDGGTPDGMYPLERAFGYHKRLKTKLKYHRFKKRDIWVDEPNSRYYNQYLTGKLGKINGKSVFSNPEIYRLLIVIEYNTKNVEARKGSMIFIHSWSDLSVPTYGCVGMKPKELESLLDWLDPNKNPTLILIREPYQ